MRLGRNINDLALEIKRQAENKKDYIVDTRTISVHPNGSLKLGFQTPQDGLTEFGLTNWGHGQLADTCGIPRTYYNRLLGMNTTLLGENVDYLLGEDPKNRLIRVLDGNIRGLLSDRYRPLDYYDLAEYVLTKIQDMGAIVESCELTETRIYFKATFPMLEGEVEVGEVVQLGICISNSEVGAGSVRIEPIIYKLACKNGLILADRSTRKFHIEKGHHDIGEFLRDETRMQMDRAFWMGVSDTIDATFNREFLDKTLEQLRSASKDKIQGDPVKALEVTMGNFYINTGHKAGLLTHLIEGGDLSRWGLTNAVTRYSQDVEDYDEATAFERIGGKILDLTKPQWQSIAMAS